MRHPHPLLAASIRNYVTCVSSTMALRCPCMEYLHYISTYISPSRQEINIVQLCRSDYYTCISSTKELPPATKYNVPDHGVQQCLDSVRASFNLVKVFFCFFFLEQEGQQWCADADVHKGKVSYILAAGVRRCADAKAIVGERRTVVTFTCQLYQRHIGWSQAQRKMPFVVLCGDDNAICGGGDANLISPRHIC